MVKSEQQWAIADGFSPKELLAALVVVSIWAVALGIALARGLALESQIPVYAYAAAASLVVVADLRTLRAPNQVVYPAFLAMLCLAGVSGMSALASASAGGLIAFGALLLAVLSSRGAMGMGDAKFGAVCGALVGLSGVATFLVASFVAGGLFAGAALVSRSRARRDVVPFTPFLVAGTLVALGVGHSYLA